MLANRSCADCKTYDYDVVTGRQKKKRDGTPKLRPAGQPTPCSRCPKISPDHEWRFRLSAKNRATLNLYYASRATGGRCLTDEEATDAILIDNFATIDQMVRAWESNTSAERLIPFLQAQKNKVGV